MMNVWTRFKIRRAKIISFDIFDTCLLRPFSKPVDVFRYLGERYNEPEFFQHRAIAEKQAREKLNKKHVNYDEIYEVLPERYLRFKEKEAELELNTIYCNPEVKQLYDYAVKLNKQIIFVTDMYYNGDFLQKLLRKNGYKRIDDIYISAYQQRSKWDKTLFPYIIDKLQVSPGDILHIGDNPKVDFQFPQEIGVRTVKVTTPKERLLSDSRIRRFIDTHQNSLTAGIIVGLIVKKIVCEKGFKNYWHEFGFIFGGPACYGLCQFIIDEMQKNDRKELLCVARDGYTIEKIVNILAPFIKTHYVYATRLINILTSLETDVASWTTYSEGIISSYAETSPEFKKRCEGKKFRNSKEMSAFVKENMDTLRPLAEKLFNTYLRYIQTLKIEDGKIALFDVNAGHFNSYKLLKRALPEKDFLGLYWLITGKKLYDCKAYSKNDKPRIKPRLLLEFIVTAPELPVKNMNPDGTFARVINTHEKHRAKIYKSISIGEVDFSQLYYLTFKDCLPFDISVCEDLLNIIDEYHTLRDYVHFRSIRHGTSLVHEKYVKLIEYAVLRNAWCIMIYYLYAILSKLLCGKQRERINKRIEKCRQLMRK